MAARKLQTEIDRTLKKVSEGVELFESIYDKMQTSTNQTQKEKLETDLKTQIKKLQRLRDQIKTWVASNDIKDKSQLLENRRLIETQMEKFKACEKEMKTKAFSKEGLIQASKLDPKAQEKLETTEWLKTKVDELCLQVEQAEAEIETLQGGQKKKKSGQANSRLEDLERLNERRKWHINRLELVLRLLDNGSLAVERVNDLKDDVTYFVESNTEDEFEEDEGIYDELNLDEEEEKFGLHPEDSVDNDEDSGDESDDSPQIPQRTPSKKTDDDSTNHKSEHSPVLRKSAVSISLRKTSNAVETSKPPPNPNFASQPMSSIVKNGLPQPRPPATTLPVRYSAAAAAAVGGTSTSGTTATQTPSASSSHSQPSTSPAAANGTHPPASSTSQAGVHDQAFSSPSLTQASISGPSPLLSSASTSGQAADSSLHSRSQSPALSDTVPSSTGAAQVTSSPQRSGPSESLESPDAMTSPLTNGASNEQQSTILIQPTAPSELQSLVPPNQQPTASSPLPQQLQQYNVASSSGSSPLPPTLQQPTYPPGVKMPQAAEQPGLSTSNMQAPPQRLASTSPSVQQQQAFGSQSQQPRGVPTNAASAFPGSLSDLVASFENVKQKAPHRMANLDQVHKLLEGGYQTMPQPLDTEKPKYYTPKNPHQTPPYYPQTPSPLLSSPSLFQNLDIETLFYVFYYLPGTYQQYLAARELKRQSWRFHVKYFTWFQRHSEPQAITEEYEQGIYVYFDWEGSWCQRKKSDFRFEYRYLSED